MGALAVLVALVIVLPKTIQSGEQGTRVRSDAALRLIEVVALHAGIVQHVFSASAGRAPKPIRLKKVGVCAARKSVRVRTRKLLVPRFPRFRRSEPAARLSPSLRPSLRPVTASF